MDKREIELAKQNILKDRRRRFLYLNKDKTEGYHITENDMRIFTLLKNANLVGLLLFLVTFGILNQSIIIGLALMALVIAGAHFYLTLVFLPKRKVIKLNDVDQQKVQSYDFLKALEAHQMSHVLILIVLAAMVFMRLLDRVKPLTGLDLEVARYSTIFFMTYAAIMVPGYLRIRKQRKAAK